MSNKQEEIELHLIEENGSHRIVDQHGRRLAKVKRIQLSTAHDEPTELTITLLDVFNGSVHINRKR